LEEGGGVKELPATQSIVKNLLDFTKIFRELVNDFPFNHLIAPLANSLQILVEGIGVNRNPWPTHLEP